MTSRPFVAAEGPDVSIVAPLYNEQDNVAPLCEAVRGALEDWGSSWELLLVDDGSTDATRERLRQEARRDSRIRVLLMQRNSGQTLAMAAGFSASQGRIVVSMDGDLQNDPRDIPLLVDTIRSGWDVVCGWRRRRQDRWLSRTLPSKIANWLIARVTGVRVHDNGCSLKAYRAEVIRSLRLYSDMHRFLPALSTMTGARVTEVVVRHHPRVRGESKYGISRIFKVLADLVTMKMLTQFGTRPGAWFALLSLPWLLLSGISLAVWLVHLAKDVPDSIVFPSLAVMFLYLAAHLLSLSVLGEMILSRSDHEYQRKLVEVLAVLERRVAFGAHRARAR